MLFHDAKTDKPKKSGEYITMKVVNYCDGTSDVYSIMNISYDVVRDGWNLRRDDRVTEVFPDYWAKKPNYEDLVWSAMEGVEV